MSIVGTRPPTLDEWNKYELHHRARLTMSGLKKTKKNNEKYVAEYKNMKEIRDEAKNNCRRIPIK